MTILVKGEDRMIRNFLILFFLCVFAVPALGGETLISESMLRFEPFQIKSDNRGNVWAAYYDIGGGLRVRNINSGKELLMNEGGEKFSKGLAFNVQGDHVFVSWVEKIDSRKLLRFRATHDGGETLSEPVILDDNATEALTRIKIQSTPGGDVIVLWYGEKVVGKSRWNVWASSSHDHGKTFSSPVMLTEGYLHSIYPTLLVEGGQAYTFLYSQREGDRKHVMIFRKTGDGGRTWSNISEIKEIGVVTLFVEPVKVGSRLHVFWFTSYEDVPVIETAYSDDEGDTWTAGFIEDTRGLDLGLFEVAHDTKGHIYLALSGKREGEKKARVYTVVSADNGTTWGPLTNLRNYPYDHTKAVSPSVAATPEGAVAVLWVDYRNIRSNIYMQYSTDSGRTWQNRDLPLEEPGRFNTRLWLLDPSLIFSGGHFYVLASRLHVDSEASGSSLIFLDFNLQNGGAQ